MKKFLLQSLCMAVVAITTHSCLFQHPELTEDGEMGVDPTEVAVSTDINISLSIPAMDPEQANYEQPSTDETVYKRRVVVEALAEGRRPVVRTMLLDIEEGTTEVNVPLTLRLTARDYSLAVWSDYVQVQENGAVDSSYFYNADLLPNVYMSKSYRGNNTYKDAGFAYTQLDLSGYRSQWNSRVSLDLKLERPVARLQLEATDTKTFLDKIAAGTLTGESFAVRVSYPGYLCMGYNIAEHLPRHSLMYMSYEHNFSTKKMAAGEPFLLTFDYLFAESESNTGIPVQLEILDSTKTEVLASASFKAYVRAGYCTTVSYGFLNSTDEEGITFDPNFSGSGSVVVVPIENNSSK